ncbi:SMP-30/gluconolactonase/LRE family protein [Spirosoma daeguense]
MIKHLKFITTVCLFLLDTPVLRAQQPSLGVFDGQTSIGSLVRPGVITYNKATQVYELSSSKANTENKDDALHLLWKRIKGDFILYGRGELMGKGSQTGWMARSSLSANAAQVSAVTQENGTTSMQLRRTNGGNLEETKIAAQKADIIQLERRGNTYTTRVARFGEPFQTHDVTEVNLGDEVYIGLFVQTSNATPKARFEDVRISVPVSSTESPNRMNLGSRLELLDVSTGKRNVIHTESYSIQAPNWTNDNKFLLYNGRGLIQAFDLNTRQVRIVNTGDVKNNNNDHVISLDGKQLGLSSGVKELGGSIIYTVPIEGGTPKQITPKGPSYLHGWSPDGKSLVFCGARNNEYDVYKVPAEGGPEVRLTDAAGLDDGPEYTPDGKYIYFNSNRTGTMQIWRMQPDGSQQEAVTDGEFNDWFAHISPDGKWIVFLSFLKDEVKSGDHPPYKHVYLRLMPITGGKPKVIAYIYGGQGTINTPSWSPDSKRVAFVSNTDASVLTPAEISEK